jgi:hypothetical protein
VKNLREGALEWMTSHPQSAVLISLIAHSTPSTGELVYAVPGARDNKYSNVDVVNISDMWFAS